MNYGALSLVFFIILILFWSRQKSTNSNESNTYSDRRLRGGRTALLFEQRMILLHEANYVEMTQDVVGLKGSNSFNQNVLNNLRESAAQRNPGIDLRATKAAFDYWIPIALKMGKTHAMQVPVSEVIHKITNYRLKFYDLSVSDLNIPSWNYEFSAPNGATFLANNILIVVSGYLQIKQEVFPATTHGPIKFTANGVTIKAIVDFSMNAAGVMQINLKHCESSIGSISMEVHLGWGSDIPRKLFDMFKGRIREKVNDKICPRVGQLIAEANTKISNFPYYFLNLKSDLKLDLHLLANPITEGGSFPHFDLPLLGETVKNPAVHDTPFVPDAMQLSSEEKMINLHVSDYVFNSFAYQATKFGLLSGIHLENSAAVKDFLRLHCEAYCMGNFARNMSAQFVDGTGQALFTTVAHPRAEFSKLGARFTFNHSLELKYQPLHQLASVLAQEFTVLTFDLLVEVNINSLNIAKISSTKLNITGLATVNYINVFNVQTKADLLKDFAEHLPGLVDSNKIIIENKMNEKLQQGYAYPYDVEKYFSVDNAIASFFDHTLVLGVNVISAQHHH